MKNENERNPLVQGLRKMVDGVEQVGLNPIFFRAWLSLNEALRKH